MQTIKKQLLIVMHAPSNNTQRLLHALHTGACDPAIINLHVVCKSPLQATAEDVMQADGIILATPENLGYMSGALKDFFDRIYYPVLENKQGLPCAVLIRAGHDGTGTQRALESILTGLRWSLTQPILVCRGEWKDAFLDQAEELGCLMAAGLEAGIF
ncbi:NAD(P)H-dependent oxidoreductase [Pseudomonas sp. F1_0610]|uniref:flavodoxin family protein n=1 Tax=Pseudomonas sp. F1_0610 TaxID=3114284 RepID=UPI0039C1B44E